MLRFIDRLASSLARAWKGLFGYQILIEAATRISANCDRLSLGLRCKTQEPFPCQRRCGDGEVVTFLVSFRLRLEIPICDLLAIGFYAIGQL